MLKRQLRCTLACWCPESDDGRRSDSVAPAVMGDDFDVAALQGESTTLFRHATAQAWLGASVFWVRRRAALGGEQAAIEQWQIRRDGSQRGIVEVTPDDQE